MKSRPLYRIRAFIALALFAANGYLPAFGATGTWVCPNGAVCAAMAARSAITAPMRATSCHPSTTFNQRTSSCRFIPTTRTVEPAQIASAFKPSATALSPAISLDDLLAAFAPERPAFMLPEDHDASPPPIRSSSSSRAPPLGTFLP